MKAARRCKMKGKRHDIEPMDMEIGDYGYFNGHWWVRAPNGDLCMVDAWTITEHEDTTITMSPSLLIHEPGDKSKPKWHGFLNHGEWSEC